MKKILPALLISLTVFVFASCGTKAQKSADKDTQTWRYDIEYIKTGANNMQLVKVWSYSKDQKTAIAQASKNAIHGVIFKGYTGGTASVSQRALMTNHSAAQQNEEFFKSFFANGGQYMKYVSSVTNETMETVKVGKEYKVGVVVAVNKDQLRKDLEEAGVVRGLTTGF